MQGTGETCQMRVDVTKRQIRSITSTEYWFLESLEVLNTIEVACGGISYGLAIRFCKVHTCSS